MLIEKKDMVSEIREKMRGGDGAVELLNIIPKENFPPKIRYTGVITLKQGCGIGSHPHEGEEELFYCISGEGALDDNGTEKVLKAGDCHICKDGQSHGILNKKDEDLKLFAVIALNS
jgi:quercetin dioxygenase-like cupin family protein